MVVILPNIDKEDLYTILNVLAPKREQKENKKCNDDEKRRLEELMLNFDVSNWQASLREVASILDKYVVSGNNDIPQPLPMLLEQTLFYICLCCNVDGRKIEKVCVYDPKNDKSSKKAKPRDKKFAVIPDKVTTKDIEWYSNLKWESNTEYRLTNDRKVTKKEDGKAEVDVKVIKRKFANNDIIMFLRMCGIDLSHNFFSRQSKKLGEFTKIFSDGDYDIYKNTNISAPINYNGKKKGSLATAIANLVFQAGNVDCIIDLFGGSGTASSVIKHYKGCKYLYNEKDTIKCVVFKSLADNSGYLKVIDELKKLQKCILFGEVTWGKYDSACDGYLLTINTLQYGNKDLEKELLRKVESNVLPKNSDAIIYAGEDAREYKNVIIPVETMIKSIVFLPDDRLPEAIRNNTGLFKLIQNKKTNEKDLVNSIISNQKLRRYLVDYFKNNCNAIMEILFKIATEGDNQYCRNLTVYTPDARYDKTNIYVFLEIRQKINLAAIYLFMTELCDSNKYSNNKSKYSDEMITALYIFKMNVAKNNSWDSDYNGVLGNYNLSMDRPISEKVFENVKKFVDNTYNGKTYDDVIKNFHNSIANTEVLNDDCFDIINRYALSNQKNYANVLFYSDSPYVSTKDYNEDGSNVDEFTSNDMKKLIQGLFNSGGKFIFSCRLLNGDKEEKKDDNFNIAKNLLLVFLETFYNSTGSATWDSSSKQVVDAKNTNLSSRANKLGQKQELYVMHICKDWQKFEDVLKGNFKPINTEIFITNYKISLFEKEKNTYQTCSFFDILKEFMKYQA